MKINFIMNNPSIHPFGGYKIIYEYANRLTEKGHSITLVYNCKNAFHNYKMPELIRYFLCFLVAKTGPNWFPLNKKVKQITTKQADDDNVPDADITIATAWNTSNIVKKLNDSKGRKYYFIQGFENWSCSDEEVKSTYKIGLKNIVIAKWLKEIVDKESEKYSIYIPNGIDFNVFYITNPIHKRNPHSISMLYHTIELKGSKDGLEVIYRLKQQYHDLKVHLFGVPKRPDNLPEWIEYIQQATQNQLKEIYNSTAIFLCPSWSEGFGLTGAESMACGCTLVSTNSQGVMEYTINEVNALISPIKDKDRLYENIVRLFNDNSLRIAIAEQGNKAIQDKLDWNKSINKFEETLKINY